MQNHHVLFVGDIRPTCNFGAIATTEALMKLVDKKMNSADCYRSIDSRVYTLEGLERIKQGESVETYCKERIEKDVSNENGSKKKVILFLKAHGMLEMALKLYHLFKKPVNNIDKNLERVPVRALEYDKYVEIARTGDLGWDYENELLEWSDLVLINAEGSIVKGTDETGKYKLDARYNLFFAYYAKKIFNKKVYIINHTVDPHNRDAMEMIQMVYPMMDGIYVRETLSQLKIKNKENIRIKFVPDALFTYKPNEFVDVRKYGIDPLQPFVCLGDSSGFNALGVSVRYDYKELYSHLIKEIREKVCRQIVFIDGFRGCNDVINSVIEENELPSIGLQNATYHELYGVLSGSKMFISGRWHASILALLGGTPILLWGADSHKTEALYSIIEYPYVFFDINSLPINIDRIISETQKIMLNETPEVIQQRISGLISAAYCNVDML